MVKSLTNASTLKADKHIRIVSLFDNEEVGSQSTAGADSNLLEACLKRLAETPIVNEERVTETVSLLICMHLYIRTLSRRVCSNPF